MSVSHYFVHVGTHFDNLAGTPSIKRINTKEDLMQAVILAHQKTAARFDEHLQHRPTYKVQRGKAWEAYKVWQDRKNLLYRACTDLAALLVAMRNRPEDTLVSYRLWARV